MPGDTAEIRVVVTKRLRDQVKQAAAASGHSITEWTEQLLEEGVKRRFVVQCFHPERVRINGWCYSCKTWIGEDGDPETDH